MITERSHSENVKVQPTRNEQEVRFRCPHCQKLYRTGSDVFDGSTPEFDCAACDKGFVLTHQIDSFGLYVAKSAQHQFEACPKCSNLRPAKQDECPSCGVFVSKYIEMQKAESPVVYELNQMWQNVVLQFDNDIVHQDFLNKCHQHMALNFAFQKYSELQKTMGFDSLCEKYIKQIQLRLEQQLTSPKFNPTKAPVANANKPFGMIQILFMAIGIIGMALLIYNKFVPTFPNFNGLVLSLTVVSFGVGLFSNTRTEANL
jgi:hypothetical protein